MTPEQLAEGVEPSLAFLLRLLLGAVLVSQGRLAFVSKLQRSLSEKDLAEVASIADTVQTPALRFFPLLITRLLDCPVIWRSLKSD